MGDNEKGKKSHAVDYVLNGQGGDEEREREDDATCTVNDDGGGEAVAIEKTQLLRAVEDEVNRVAVEKANKNSTSKQHSSSTTTERKQYVCLHHPYD